jgi:hypothetical protein
MQALPDETAGAVARASWRSGGGKTLNREVEFMPESNAESQSNADVEEPEGRVAIRAPRRTGRGAHLVRYTTTEWQTICDAAEACHKTGPGFVRETSLAAARGGQSAPEKLPLIAELGRCGNALARLAATAKATGALPQAESLEVALAELLTAVRRLDRPRSALTL